MHLDPAPFEAAVFSTHSRLVRAGHCGADAAGGRAGRGADAGADARPDGVAHNHGQGAGQRGVPAEETAATGAIPASA